MVEMLHCSSSRNLCIKLINKSPGYWKPQGLWYSPIQSSGYSAWQEWCRDNYYTGNYEYLVEEIPGDDLLLINSEEGVEELWNDYSVSTMIDWNRVSEKYIGVEFSNYKTLKSIYKKYCQPRHEKFNQALLILSLDCDSGCIWDVSNITLKPRFE